MVEERGLPVDKLYIHGSGWQAHLEDLGQSLAANATAHPEGWTEQSPAPAWRRRWDELTPAYEAMEVEWCPTRSG